MSVLRRVVATNVRFDCDCAAHPELAAHATGSSELPVSIHCNACGRERVLHHESLSRQGGLAGCIACAHPELYTRKSFPPALGIGIVIAAAVLAPFTHYISLAVAALLDLVLFRSIPDVLVCYVCLAEHRGFSNEPRHPRFDREIEERVRYGPRAVMGKPMREGGTADAPEPEH